ncbi:MAG: SAM-dependent methyltransferase [Methanomicrobiales archaeon]
MTMRIREVPLEELASVKDSEWTDPNRRPFVYGKTAYVPVREGCSSDGSLGQYQRYRGRGYHMIGPIAVVRGEQPTSDEVQQIIEWQRPQGVVWVPSHSGVCRIPSSQVLYGSSGDVLHRESGIFFLLDPTKVMFSQGNRTEKERIAGLTREGERVADMYAGIGYFTLPVARAGGLVHAMEINPVAFGYLQKNILINKLSDRIEVSCGDCRDLLAGEYDRVIMGHFDSSGALSRVLPHVHPGSVIHIHSSGQHPTDLGHQLKAAGFEAEIETRAVKKTAPHCWHYVQDVRLA